MANKLSVLAATILSSLALVACDGSSTPDASDPGALQADPLTLVESGGPISRVSIGFEVAEYFSGTPPTSTGTMRVVPLDSDERGIFIISGGSVEIPLSTDAEFSTVYLVPDNQGYFSIQLATSTQATTMILTSRDDLNSGEDLQMRVVIETPSGEISEVPLTLTPLEVGTGDIQVSVSWDTPTDVDLYVTEPSGREISFLNGLSDTGGNLDLDSNPDCEIDGFNNENVTYQGGSPALGEYVAGVRYYSNCDVVVPTNFVMTVRANETTQTYTGQLIPQDSSETKSVEVIRFDVR